MDAFYASVELLRYPELRGRPVVIGGGRRHQPAEIVDPATGSVARTFATLRDYAGRGVITTATYEARAFGVHSAHGPDEGRGARARRGPAADRLRRVPRATRGCSRPRCAQIAPRIEDRGIDEIYIDLTDVPPRAHDAAASRRRRGGGARDVAKALKAAVRDATGLSCSIARRAEQAAREDRLRARQARRPHAPARRRHRRRASGRCRCARINGIGPKAAAKLEALGIAHHRRARAAPTSRGSIEHFGRTLRRVAARRGARPRRPRRS